MIRNWGITNFKSVSDGTGLLELGPITLLAGANSSGKSTIIQSILLLMQTFVQRNQNSLVLNGDLIALGTVTDLWHNGRTAESPELTIEVCIDDPSNPERELWIELSFIPLVEAVTKLNRGIFRVVYPNEELECALGVHTKNGNLFVDYVTDAFAELFSQALNDKGYEPIDVLQDSPVRLGGLFPRMVTVPVAYRPDELDWPAALQNPLDTRFTDEALQDLIPEKYRSVLLEISERLNITSLFHMDQHKTAVFNATTLGELRICCASLSSQQLRDWQIELERTLASDSLVEKDLQWDLRGLPHFMQLEDAYRSLFTRQIRYLGANRSAPTVIFSPSTASHWSEVGVDGSNVASALHAFSRRTITWFDPMELRRRDTSLLKAVAHWLQFFGILDDIETEDRGKLGTLLKVRSLGVDHDLDLTSVGFGVSQLLPILVQGLLTPRDGVFIVEQPEVHLHPAVQSKLAYFFLALTRNRVQCIIETHSENIVNQFRLLKTDKRLSLHDDIRVYFAERDLNYGTQLYEIEVDKKGNIRNWPPGFMDETTKQNAAILRAMLTDEDGEE